MNDDDISRRWRRRRRRFRRRIRESAWAIGIFVFAVAVLYSLRPGPGGKASAPTTTSAPRVVPATADVQLTSCTYANYAATAGLTVTNHTQQKMNYTIHVLFTTGKYFFTSGAVATLSYVNPGQRVKTTAVGLSTLNPIAPVKCGIFKIDRFP